MIDPRTKAFNAERRRQLRRDAAIQKKTLKDIIRQLKAAQREINDTLTNSPTEWEAWYLPQLQSNIKAALNEFKSQSSAQISQGADASFAAGRDLIDEPVKAARFNIAAQLPDMDTRKLWAMKYFMTDKIQDISTQLAAKINSEMGLVAIGAQTPSGARQTISRLFKKDGQRRALAIVRTELGRVYSAAAQQRMDQAQEILPGLKKQWRRSGKLHSRLTHDAADGQIRGVNEPFTIGSITMMYPKDPTAPIGEVIHCGCQSIPYMDSWQMKNPGRKPFTQTEIDADANKRLLSGAGLPENRANR